MKFPRLYQNQRIKQQWTQANSSILSKTTNYDYMYYLDYTNYLQAFQNADNYQMSAH